MDVEVRHLQALVAVAEAGTFGRAAESLGYTQSAVSQQIAALERVAGTPMFERPGGPRPVRLTPAGSLLLEHARSVLATLGVASTEIEEVARGERGRLRVGLMQSVGTRILPGILTRFTVERPQVEFVLHEAHDAKDLLDMVASHDLDLAFGVELDPEGPFATRKVLEDPFVVLAPNTAAWRDRGPMSIAEIARHPLVGNRNPSCQGQALLAFGDLEPNYVFNSDDNTTIQSCVAAGLGISLAPMLTLDLSDPTTTIIEVEPPVPTRSLTVSWHRDRRPSALLESFVDAAVDVCEGIAAEWATERAA